jgi:hypothetical protein
MNSHLYRDAANVASLSDPYPALAGHADFALPYIGTLVRTPEFLNSVYLQNVVRDVADKYTFATEYVRASRFYAMYRASWTDKEAEAAGRDYQRAMHDVIPATSEEAPF